MNAYANAELAPYENPKLPLEQRVDDLLARLSTSEKISLMAGSGIFETQGIGRLRIPALNFSDGPNGVRSNTGDYATVFPPGVALGATWNPNLLQEVGAAIGREARAMNIHV